MSTEATLVIVSTSSKETEQIGEKIGHNLRGGETIELISDLGGGKTTFVHGLAKGAGSTDNVASPTFTLSREYLVKGPSFHKLVHFDFYRLQEVGVISYELSEAVADSKNVVIVEWADVVQDVLPEKRLKIHIKTTGEMTRELRLHYSHELDYLAEGLS